jgi:CRISPR system Cascade subunit CasC
MIIQFHILQNYAPSNLNRDENNSPKSAFFGGVERGRVSSQSLKRAMRWSKDWWRDAFETDMLAERTKLPYIVHKELIAMRGEGAAIDDAALDAIVKRVPDIIRKSEENQNAPTATQGDDNKVDAEDEKAEDAKPKEKGARGKKAAKAKSPEQEAEDRLKAGQLVYIAPNEHRLVAEVLWELYQQSPAGFAALDLNKKLKERKFTLKPRSVDIAMFGRMITSDAFENVQASVQVAHAISTHKMETEPDYFTALDDRLNQAGVLNDVEFNSGTYYKYVNIFWQGLLDNLDGNVEMARKAAAQLLQAAVYVQPPGKINPFANHQLPDFVLVEVRDKNLPLSYANAFRKPLRAGEDNDLMRLSEEALSDYLGRMSKMYSLVDNRAFTASFDCVVPGAVKKDSINELVEWLTTDLAAR